MNDLSDFKKSLILSDYDKQQGYWMLDDTHFSKPLAPLFASLLLPAVTIGSKRAFDNMKMPIAQFVVKTDHGYYYQLMPPHPEPLEERMPKHKKKMEELFPRIKSYLERTVDDLLLPFYNKLSELSAVRLSPNEALHSIKDLQQFYEKTWQSHFEISIPRTYLAVTLEELYGQVTGSENTAEVYDYLQGIMNMSLETDRGLWLLANQAKSSPWLRSALATSASPIETLQHTAEGREFLNELRDFLNIYGHRTAATHEYSEETWFENPSYALSLIANYIQKDYDFDSAFKGVVSERDAKVKELFDRLPDNELTNRFKMMYEWAFDCWGADEDHHFYIDAMIAAKSRYFFKNVGRTLVEHQVIGCEEDIFYLYLDDVLDALQLPKPLHEVVEINKRKCKENRSRKPEPFLGVPPATLHDPVIERIFGKPHVHDATSGQAKSFKGSAASRGTYTGTVKIIGGQEDFSKLTKGDILVCKTMTPPWTVLFSIAGALITDAGGVLSHASIVAREYKLPAVVGTKVATSFLQDGDRITVDGTNGVVYMD
ncbi:PEP-utilizing enzyme [Paenibacillus ginsengarvi]|uniref:PEP-utilizing protein n=1 Tax=Paenibacillus ginsengarvi TaxID=400777 RepID=A0A3B0C7I2_9BACL|nr:PEP-utilizing enzyme [Paenibacillus ginsengarvi]RKN81972.1 PEP-utilizing protein [Paenibacillus ginsengarvi]